MLGVNAKDIGELVKGSVKLLSLQQSQRMRLRPTLLPIPGKEPSGCAIRMCVGVVRLQLQCPAVAGDRLVQLPLVVKNDAQVAVRLGIVRLRLQPGGSRRLEPPTAVSLTPTPNVGSAWAEAGALF